MLVAMALAIWPVLRWYFLRTIDRSDEPYGMLALITVAVIALRNRERLEQRAMHYVWPAALLAVYVFAFDLLSPLPRAILAVGIIGAVWFRGRGAAACWGLLALSLPVIASAQFYAGYPLRICAAEASAASLRVLGYFVTREGSLLHWRGETIMVDAPCSGVRMLWVGLYLACSFAAWYRLDGWRTAAVLVGSLLIVIAANVVRSTALFFKEAQIISLPQWTHAAIGAAVFAAAVLLVLRLGQQARGNHANRIG
jgi:exosortase